jgi:hypothetical protein
MITMRNVFFVTILLSFFINETANAKEIAGEIVSVSGLVFIRPESAKGNLPNSPPRAKPGDVVYSGDVINTSSNGAVKVLMRDKSIVDIGASTLFKMDEYIHNKGSDRKAKLDLMFGKMRVSVTKKIEGQGKFQVKTKGATMGVRGTEFIVKEDLPDRLSKQDRSVPSEPSEKPKTEITVVQGKVEVTAAPVPQPEKKNGEPAKVPETKTVNLTAGTQLTTGAGVSSASIAPVKVSETQLQALKVETKIVDNTFAKAVTIDPMSLNESRGADPGRGPASGVDSSVFNNIVAAINVGLPPVITGPPPVIDVPGVPVNPFQTISLKNNMKRVQITIIPPSYNE